MICPHCVLSFLVQCLALVVMALGALRGLWRQRR